MPHPLIQDIKNGATCQRVDLNTGYKNEDYQAQINNERPNIVLIMAEDLSPRLGAYQDKVAKTPNIDALAQEGVRFENTYAMAPVCAPSRASMITGCFAHTIGLQHMRTSNFPKGGYVGQPPAHIKAFPEQLRASGYMTFNDVKADYQFVENIKDHGPFSIWDAHGTYMDEAWMHVPAIWQHFPLQDKPFYVQLNPQITHESALFTKEYAAEYVWPVIDFWDEYRSQYNFTPTDPKQVELEPYFPDTPEVRQEIARLYDNVQIFDHQVGLIIDKLKHDGLWDNTILIVTTDHGDCIPRHKRDIYESGLKVPLIVKIPEKYQPQNWPAQGSTSSQLVSFEDLAPTILSLAKAPTPSHMQGISLTETDKKRDYVYSFSDRMDQVSLRSRTIRDEKFRYIRHYQETEAGHDLRYRDNLGMMQAMKRERDANQLNTSQMKWFEKRPQEELFDLDQDPHELINLANDPAYKNELIRLRKALAHWLSKNGDMSIIDEEQMAANLLDKEGYRPITLAPVGEYDALCHQFRIANQTSQASIGYRIDGGAWQLYTQGIDLPSAIKTIEFKAVRYGYFESETVLYNFDI